MLRPAPEIILLGTDDGTAEIAREFGLRHIPEIEYSEYGTPRLDSIHREVERAAHNPLLCIVNADIVLMSDFMRAVERVADRKKQFLMVGQRWNLDVRQPLENGANWEEQLRSEVGRSGRLGPRTGEDYIVYPKGYFGEIPAFVVGHSYADGWLLYQARMRKLDLIDATAVVMAVHQNHDYFHIQKSTTGHIDDPQTKRNEELSGGPSKMLIIKDRTHVLTSRGLRPALDGWRLWRLLRTALLLHPSLPLPLRLLLKSVNKTADAARKMFVWLRLREPYGGPRHG